MRETLKNLVIHELVIFTFYSMIGYIYYPFFYLVGMKEARKVLINLAPQKYGMFKLVLLKSITASCSVPESLD